MVAVSRQIQENSSRNFSESSFFWVVTRAVFLEISSILFETSISWTSARPYYWKTHPDILESLKFFDYVLCWISFPKYPLADIPEIEILKKWMSFPGIRPVSHPKNWNFGWVFQKVPQHQIQITLKNVQVDRTTVFQQCFQHGNGMEAWLRLLPEAVLSM